MITSMTGFGSGAAESGGVQVRATLRSVNSRFCDIQIRSSSSVQEFELKVRERLQECIGRGKITVQIEWIGERGASALPALDEAVARRYLDELQRLREIGTLKGEVDLRLLAGLPGVFGNEAAALEGEEVEKLVLEAVNRALGEFEQMRRAEGEALAADLRARLGRMEVCLDRIEMLAENAAQRIQARLGEKVEALLRPGKVDEERLAMEVALLAERSDIAEEIVRFHSHNTQFLAALEGGGEVGRRCNFLLQEMHREANTISSKSFEAEIVHLTVEIKEEVERMREQVQNLA